jgi:hypothetical protein
MVCERSFSATTCPLPNPPPLGEGGWEGGKCKEASFTYH